MSDNKKMRPKSMDTIKLDDKELENVAGGYYGPYGPGRPDSRANMVHCNNCNRDYVKSILGGAGIINTKCPYC